MNTSGSSFWSSGSIPLIEPELLRSIVAAASDIALVVSGEGTILSVLLNKHDESYGNLDHWEGREISAFLTAESVQKFTDAHSAFLAGSASKRLLELNHVDNAAWEFPIRYTFHRIGQDETVLMLGRDLRPIAETQQQLVRAQMALEQGYEARREFDARYRILLANTREPMVFVAVEDGRIIDCNNSAATLLGGDADALNGTVFAMHFDDTKSGEFIELLVSSSGPDAGDLPRARLRNGRRSVSIPTSLFRAAGDRVLLCRLDTTASTPGTDESLTGQLMHLYREGRDAILFTDDRGQITEANEGFLELVDAGNLTDVKGRSLADFLSRGQIDKNMLLENAKNGGQVRVYSTKLVNDLGSRLSIEVVVTYLGALSHPAYGFVIRDISRAEAVRPASANKEDANRNVVELVGSATLKDIVSETTDVVEKMCIETAVSLTRNNRVAAAEMLGLSRQSLYVKLRKYGLLNKHKDGDPNDD